MERQLILFKIFILFVCLSLLFSGCASFRSMDADTIPTKNEELMDKDEIFNYVILYQDQLELLIVQLDQYEVNVRLGMKDGDVTVHADDDKVIEMIFADAQLMETAYSLLVDYSVLEISKSSFQTSEGFKYIIWFPMLANGEMPTVVYSEDNLHEGELIVGKWKYKTFFGT